MGRRKGRREGCRYEATRRKKKKTCVGKGVPEKVPALHNLARVPGRGFQGEGRRES